MSQSEAAAPAVAFTSNTEVAIHVPDLEVARAFYVDVLGFRLATMTADYLELDSGAL